MHMMDQKTQLVNFWKQKFKFKESELKAFIDVDRKYFVLPELLSNAYEDKPLPIMRGKTISQPTTVMIMTHCLELEPGEKVFEVGAGSGYQSAIIANIVGEKGKVISTEVVPELVQFARDNLKKAGISNVTIYEDDGSKGMTEEAPFDKIIITAACKEFPNPLIEQLKVDGIIVAPVGDVNTQEMVKGIKGKDGKLSMTFLGPFLFTPMYGKYGFEV